MSDQKQGVPSFAALKAALNKNREAVEAGPPSIAVGSFIVPEIPEEEFFAPELTEPAEAPAPENPEEMYVPEIPETEAAVPEAGYAEEAMVPEAGYAEETMISEAGYAEEAAIPEAGYPAEPAFSETGYTEEASVPEVEYTVESVASESGYAEEASVSEAEYTTEPAVSETGYPDEFMASEAGYVAEPAVPESEYSDESVSPEGIYNIEETPSEEGILYAEAEEAPASSVSEETEPAAEAAFAGSEEAEPAAEPGFGMSEGTEPAFSETENAGPAFAGSGEEAYAGFEDSAPAEPAWEEPPIVQELIPPAEIVVTPAESAMPSFLKNSSKPRRKKRKAEKPAWPAAEEGFYYAADTGNMQPTPGEDFRYAAPMQPTPGEDFRDAAPMQPTAGEAFRYAAPMQPMAEEDFNYSTAAGNMPPTIEEGSYYATAAGSMQPAAEGDFLYAAAPAGNMQPPAEDTLLSAAAAAGPSEDEARARAERAAIRRRRREEKSRERKEFLKLYTETVFNDQPVPEDMEKENSEELALVEEFEAEPVGGKKEKKPKKPGFFDRFRKPKTPLPTIDPATVERNDSLEGLTSEEVDLREKASMVNYTQKKGVRTTKQILIAHTVTYFNILNLLLGFLIFLTGQYKNMLFMGVIICNSVIGIVQELKVKSLIDKLSVITASKVTVRRNNEDVVIPTDKIVLDDVVYLSVGDQIVTDGRVYACRGLEVNESMLTGESKPVKKKDGDPVLSGSFIVAGTAVMKVDKVGADCYASQLVSKAQTKKRASSEMQTTIGRIIKVVSVAIIPIGLLLYRSQAAANGGDFAGAVVRTVSGVIGMIPEGLVLLTSVSFIIGVGRLAQKKALVQEMEAIEALARTNILCTDKTGTITTGELKVHKILPFGSATAEQIRTILGHVNGAFDDTNATQEAMNRAFGTYDDWPVREIIPFSSSRKYRAVSFGSRGDYAIGAPEFLMPGNGKLRALVDKYSEEGYRVLLLGRSSGISAALDSHGSITPVALIIISDIIKEDAKEIFNYFADAGVEVKVLSGDNPVTVSTVARRAGVRGAENYVDATTLPEKPAELAREITKYSVFGRVKPEQKQAFVKAWQMSGHTVAMVGDGVNDVLAIKDADCGIAMAAGSEAAKQAAHIVLMDSDFSSMKDIVKEGRTIISNIERVSSLYLTKTIYSSVLCLIFILLQTKYPFTTLQMGLINVCGIGMPSFLLTLEQQDNVHSEGFLKHVLAVCLPAAMTFVTSMLIVQILNALFRWPTDIYATFNLMLGGFVALLVVADVCWPLNSYRKFVLVTSIVTFIVGLLIFPGFYDMHTLFMWWTLLLIPLCFLVAMLLFWYSRVTNRFMVKVLKFREERKRIF